MKPIRPLTRSGQDLNLHNYGHLLRWQQYADLQLGRTLSAKALLERARSDYTASGKAEPIGTALFRMSAQYIIETGQGDLASALAAEARADGFFGNAFVLQGVGLGAAMAGELDLAREVAETFRSRTAWRPQVQHHQILGLIALAEGDPAGALRHLERSVEISDENVRTLGLALPNPSKPSWELYGEVLLRLDRPLDALAQFERALEIYRRRSASLLGAARANDRLGRHTAATEYYAELLNVWRGAQADHAGLVEARRFLTN